MTATEPNASRTKAAARSRASGALGDVRSATGSNPAPDRVRGTRLYPPFPHASAELRDRAIQPGYERGTWVYRLREFTWEQPPVVRVDTHRGFGTRWRQQDC